MKIAYLTNGYPKISHTFIRREIIELERQGVEIFRIALRGWDHPVVDPVDDVEKGKTRYVLNQSLPTIAGALLRSLLRHPAGLASATWAALKLMRKSDQPKIYHLFYLVEACVVAGWLVNEKVDQIHAHFGTNSAEVAMLAHLIATVPFSFTMHGSQEFDMPEYLGLAEKIRQASFVSAVSSFTRSQLYRWCPYYDWPKIRIVRCGLDELFTAPPPPTPALSRRFVCVGRIYEGKGPMILLEAARQLAAEGLQFEVEFAGEGEMRREIEARAAKLGLKDRISITGWLSAQQVHEHIRAARCLIHPSFAEGVPVVIMEALALERPAIATYVGGVPELVENGKSGWLVPAGSADDLADAMRLCLAADDEEILNLGRNGRDRVLRLHDVKRECSGLRELFRQSVMSGGAMEPGISSPIRSSPGISS